MGRGNRGLSRGAEDIHESPDRGLPALGLRTWASQRERGGAESMQGCWTPQVRGGLRGGPTLGHALTQIHLGTNLMDTPRPCMVRHRLLTSDAPRSIFRSEDGTHAVMFSPTFK